MDILNFNVSAQASRRVNAKTHFKDFGAVIQIQIGIQVPK